VILIPAIDIRGGAAVRLLRGDFGDETTYDADPADAARRWSAEGAELLHVVDLDGARAGTPQNIDAIGRVAAAAGCPVQVGGGLRDADSVNSVLDAGAERIVIGTAAIKDPDFLDQMLDTHGERVVVSVDAHGGRVATEGWTEGSGEDAVEAIAALGERGVGRFLCTAIEVDGTMAGPALEDLTRIAAATPARVIASGGVGTLDDLRALGGLAAPNLEGAIVGRALYERRFTVAEGIGALRSS
jgi:phosphoribosylformimino-5-aminoimidazole carboxamide ribotide isomerase